MGFLPEREICAASKYIRRIDAYIDYNRGNQTSKNGRFHRVELTNGVNDTEVKYRKTDCSGDSGGPLWKWMGKSNPMATVSHLHILLKFKWL